MSVNTDPGIVCEGLCVVRGSHTALADVSFSVEAGTLTGVLGPNGAGKSTLFGAIAGTLPIKEGRVTLLGAASRRGAVAYVPQRDSINWLFPATVMDVVTMGCTNRLGLFRQPGRRDREKVRDCLERVDMWDMRSALITQLSGGQRQRVFIARALAQEACCVLLDEAFSGVDVGAQEGIVEVLQSLRDEGKIVMLATHDLTNLSRRFDRVLCLNHHVCAYGSPSEAFTAEVLEEMYGAHGIELAPDHQAGGGVL